MPKTPLTEKQQRVFDYVESCIASGLPPTYKEIAVEIGVATNAACCHMRAIEKKGWLEITANKSRAIKLVK